MGNRQTALKPGGLQVGEMAERASAAKPKPGKGRAAGQPQGRNAPAELPHIAQVLADLRGLPLDTLAAQTTANALHALPRLQGRVG